MTCFPLCVCSTLSPLHVSATAACPRHDLLACVSCLSCSLCLSHTQKLLQTSPAPLLHNQLQYFEALVKSDLIFITPFDLFNLKFIFTCRYKKKSPVEDHDLQSYVYCIMWKCNVFSVPQRALTHGGIFVYVVGGNVWLCFSMWKPIGS